MEIGEGWITCNIYNRLKDMKGSLKIWNKMVFGNLKSKIKICSNKLECQELRVES